MIRLLAPRLTRRQLLALLPLFAAQPPPEPHLPRGRTFGSAAPTS